LLRPCLENSLRPLYEGLSGLRHPGDLEEGLNRRGARDLDDRRNSDATATRRLDEVETRAKLYAAETQASFDGPMAFDLRLTYR
jgi:hypothetical protein